MKVANALIASRQPSDAEEILDVEFLNETI